jgi:hypothetical protein
VALRAFQADKLAEGHDHHPNVLAVRTVGESTDLFLEVEVFHYFAFLA